MPMQPLGHLHTKLTKITKLQLSRHLYTAQQKLAPLSPSESLYTITDPSMLQESLLTSPVPYPQTYAHCTVCKIYRCGFVGPYFRHITRKQSQT